MMIAYNPLLLLVFFTTLINQYYVLNRLNIDVYNLYCTIILAIAAGLIPGIEKASDRAYIIFMLNLHVFAWTMRRGELQIFP